MMKLLVLSAIVAVAFGAADPKPGFVSAYGVAPYYSSVGTPAATVKTGSAVVAAPVAYSAYPSVGYGYNAYSTPYTYSSGYVAPYAGAAYTTPYAYASPYGYGGYAARSYYY